MYKNQKPQTSALAEDEEMFVIPASQITTQSRYISQRSLISRTQISQPSSSRLARNYFELALQKCAVNFEVPECYVLGNFQLKKKSFNLMCLSLHSHGPHLLCKQTAPTAEFQRRRTRSQVGVYGWSRKRNEHSGWSTETFKRLQSVLPKLGHIETDTGESAAGLPDDRLHPGRIATCFV